MYLFKHEWTNCKLHFLLYCMLYRHSAAFLLPLYCICYFIQVNLLSTVLAGMQKWVGNMEIKKSGGMRLLQTAWEERLDTQEDCGSGQTQNRDLLPFTLILTHSGWNKVVNISFNLFFCPFCQKTRTPGWNWTKQPTRLQDRFALHVHSFLPPSEDLQDQRESNVELKLCRKTDHWASNSHCRRQCCETFREHVKSKTKEVFGWQYTVWFCILGNDSKSLSWKLFALRGSRFLISRSFPLKGKVKSSADCLWHIGWLNMQSQICPVYWQLNIFWVGF